ncbi:hypothetical protein [Brevundimonas sp.]|uniref:hypothetical protein n=1 Tax=Brevundimonas sp. TaxID=1871086 RepID=UPI002FCA219A
MTRYPVLPAIADANAQSLNCQQLNSELELAHQTRTQVNDIADGRVKNVRPVLYSTARADADRSIQARISQIETLRQQKACAA